MKKEEKIKEAYKKYFNECDVDHRFYISINGWSDKLNLELIKDDEFLKELDIRQITFRPKSLQGIEDNNGWIKIESEEDLPKDEESLFESGIMKETGEFIQERKRHALKTLKWLFERKQITHYQPIVKPKPPIY